MTDELQALEERWHIAKDLVVPDRGVVVVAGAYKGLVMEYILTKFPNVGRVVGFEPQRWASMLAVERLMSNHDKWGHSTVTIHHYGLLAEKSTNEFSLAVERPMFEFGTDACSLLESAGTRTTAMGKFKPFSTAFFSGLLGMQRADLFILNMEGYEFTLLPWLIEHDYMQYIDAWAVQFHEHAAKDLYDLTRQMNEIYDEPVVDHYPEWVYWRRHFPNSKCEPNCNRTTSHSQPEGCTLP